MGYNLGKARAGKEVDTNKIDDTRGAIRRWLIR